MKKTLFVMSALLLVLVVGALFYVNLRTRQPCRDWLSWKDNTYPHCTSFEIREEGKYPWFGSIKIGYALPVSAGDKICVKVEADNDGYAYDAMIYWGVESGEIDAMAQPLDMRAGDIRCVKATPTMVRVVGGYEKCSEFFLFRIHWCGTGKGGVTATPLVWVEKAKEAD